MAKKSSPAVMDCYFIVIFTRNLVLFVIISQSQTNDLIETGKSSDRTAATPELGAEY